MAGVHAPHSGIAAIDGSSGTAAAARQQQHGSSGNPQDCQTRSPAPHADHLQRAVETLRRTRITAGGRSPAPGGLPAVSKPAEPPRAEIAPPRQPLTCRAKTARFFERFWKNSDRVFEKFLESLEKFRRGIRSAIVAE